jgi:hypothetical protein
MAGRYLLWEKMPGPSTGWALVSLLTAQAVAYYRSTLTGLLDLLKVWVEDNLDLYKV